MAVDPLRFTGLPIDLPCANGPASSTTAAKDNGHPSEDDADVLADRALVQNFARKVIEADIADSIVVLFLPWTPGQDVPRGILCPSLSIALLDAAQLQEAIRGKSVALCPFTFKYPAEERAAARIVEQLCESSEMWILAAHLPTQDMHLSDDCGEYTNNILRRITKTRVDDVLLDLDTEPSALRLRIKMAKHTCEANREKKLATLPQEARVPTDEEIKDLEATYHHLLWEDIPRELMENFSLMDPHLNETDDSVDDYKLLKKRVTSIGAVWDGKDKHGRKVAIKCIDKKRSSTLGEVEAINREYTFLRAIVAHPNIVRALDFLHSQTYIYIIMEHVGDQNLAEYLSNLPGNHLDHSMAIGIFREVVSAVAHCHGKHITHRNVALENVVLAKADEDRLIATLVDFHYAIVSKPGVMSRTCCGELPCIAPEILSGQPYIPIFADVWSIGVLLLEMAGGLGSLVNAVDLTQADMYISLMSEETKQASANKIRIFFIVPGNHENALANVDGVRSERISDLLKSLLVAPIDRPSLQNLHRKLA